MMKSKSHTSSRKVSPQHHGRASRRPRVFAPYITPSRSLLTAPTSLHTSKHIIPHISTNNALIPAPPQTTPTRQMAMVRSKQPLSYRHLYHAGNHADVMKHAILIQLAAQQIRKIPFGRLFIDTHAGPGGTYDLQHEYARKTQEFTRGVGRIYDIARVSALNPHITSETTLRRGIDEQDDGYTHDPLYLRLQAPASDLFALLPMQNGHTAPGAQTRSIQYNTNRGELTVPIMTTPHPLLHATNHSTMINPEFEDRIKGSYFKKVGVDPRTRAQQNVLYRLTKFISSIANRLSTAEGQQMLITQLKKEFAVLKLQESLRQQQAIQKFGTQMELEDDEFDMQEFMEDEGIDAEKDDFTDIKPVSVVVENNTINENIDDGDIPMSVNVGKKSMKKDKQSKPSPKKSLKKVKEQQYTSNVEFVEAFSEDFDQNNELYQDFDHLDDKSSKEIFEIDDNISQDDDSEDNFDEEIDQTLTNTHLDQRAQIPEVGDAKKHLFTNSQGERTTFRRLGKPVVKICETTGKTEVTIDPLKAQLLQQEQIATELGSPRRKPHEDLLKVSHGGLQEDPIAARNRAINVLTRRLLVDHDPIKDAVNMVENVNHGLKIPSSTNNLIKEHKLKRGSTDPSDINIVRTNQYDTSALFTYFRHLLPIPHSMLPYLSLVNAANKTPTLNSIVQRADYADLLVGDYISKEKAAGIEERQKRDTLFEGNFTQSVRLSKDEKLKLLKSIVNGSVIDAHLHDIDDNYHKHQKMSYNALMEDDLALIAEHKKTYEEKKTKNASKSRHDDFNNMFSYKNQRDNNNTYNNHQVIDEENGIAHLNINPDELFMQQHKPHISLYNPNTDRQYVPLTMRKSEWLSPSSLQTVNPDQINQAGVIEDEDKVYPLLHRPSAKDILFAPDPTKKKRKDERNRDRQKGQNLKPHQLRDGNAPQYRSEIDTLYGLDEIYGAEETPNRFKKRGDRYADDRDSRDNLHFLGKNGKRKGGRDDKLHGGNIQHLKERNEHFHPKLNGLSNISINISSVHDDLEEKRAQRDNHNVNGYEFTPSERNFGGNDRHRLRGDNKGEINGNNRHFDKNRDFGVDHPKNKREFKQRGSNEAHEQPTKTNKLQPQQLHESPQQPVAKLSLRELKRLQLEKQSSSGISRHFSTQVKSSPKSLLFSSIPRHSAIQPSLITSLPPTLRILAPMARLGVVNPDFITTLLKQNFATEKASNNVWASLMSKKASKKTYNKTINHKKEKNDDNKHSFKKGNGNLTKSDDSFKKSHPITNNSLDSDLENDDFIDFNVKNGSEYKKRFEPVGDSRRSRDLARRKNERFEIWGREAPSTEIIGIDNHWDTETPLTSTKTKSQLESIEDINNTFVDYSVDIPIISKAPIKSLYLTSDTPIQTLMETYNTLQQKSKKQNGDEKETKEEEDYLTRHQNATSSLFQDDVDSGEKFHSLSVLQQHYETTSKALGYLQRSLALYINDDKLFHSPLHQPLYNAPSSPWIMNNLVRSNFYEGLPGHPTPQDPNSPETQDHISQEEVIKAVLTSDNIAHAMNNNNPDNHKYFPMIKDILILNELHSTEYQTLRKNHNETIMNEFYHESVEKQKMEIEEVAGDIQTQSNHLKQLEHLNRHKNMSSDHGNNGLAPNNHFKDEYDEYGNVVTGQRIKAVKVPLVSHTLGDAISRIAASVAVDTTFPNNKAMQLFGQKYINFNKLQLPITPESHGAHNIFVDKHEDFDHIQRFAFQYDGFQAAQIFLKQFQHYADFVKRMSYSAVTPNSPGVKYLGGIHDEQYQEYERLHDRKYKNDNNNNNVPKKKDKYGNFVSTSLMLCDPAYETGEEYVNALDLLRTTLDFNSRGNAHTLSIWYPILEKIDTTFPNQFESKFSKLARNSIDLNGESLSDDDILNVVDETPIDFDMSRVTRRDINRGHFFTSLSRQFDSTPKHEHHSLFLSISSFLVNEYRNIMQQPYQTGKPYALQAPTGNLDTCVAETYVGLPDNLPPQRKNIYMTGSGMLITSPLLPQELDQSLSTMLPWISTALSNKALTNVYQHVVQTNHSQQPRANKASKNEEISSNEAELGPLADYTLTWM